MGIGRVWTLVADENERGLLGLERMKDTTCGLELDMT